MEESAISAIFTAAATATSWERTGLGLRTTVPHDGYDWIVRLPKGNGRAFIAGSTGWGGDTSDFIEATWAETGPIVEAAVSATRIL